ncbi:MAG: hypothetical protein N2545_03565, partial [Thermoflexales bacterium]|nr:hypothetical protein [Thermoflexales bacterium]
LPGEEVVLSGGAFVVDGRVMLALEAALAFAPTAPPSESRRYLLEEDEYLVAEELVASRALSEEASLRLVRRSAIIGRAWLIFWPIEALALVQHPRLQFAQP